MKQVNAKTPEQLEMLTAEDDHETLLAIPGWKDLTGSILAKIKLERTKMQLHALKEDGLAYGFFRTLCQKLLLTGTLADSATRNPHSEYADSKIVIIIYLLIPVTKFL
ncbi:Uncharacterised protein r2_g4117 [Pycnogonum litorale]